MSDVSEMNFLQATMASPSRDAELAGEDLGIANTVATRICTSPRDDHQGDKRGRHKD